MAWFELLPNCITVSKSTGLQIHTMYLNVANVVCSTIFGIKSLTNSSNKFQELILSDMTFFHSRQNSAIFSGKILGIISC